MIYSNERGGQRACVCVARLEFEAGHLFFRSLFNRDQGAVWRPGLNKPPNPGLLAYRTFLGNRGPMGGLGWSSLAFVKK